MKKVFLAIAISFAIIYAAAQTTATPWSGVETQQLLANCQLHNTDSVVCVATDGVAFSYQGAAFVTVSQKAAPAPTFTATATGLPAGSTPTVAISGSAFTFGIPAGATGAKGATGVTGPAGPVQSFGSAQCPAYTVSGSSTASSIQLGPGCTEAP